MNSMRKHNKWYIDRSRFDDVRSGFTLVELMVVVIVMGILMALVMVALRGAQQDAFTAKTRATIRKIDVVIQDRYEEYLYASVESSVTAPALPPGFVVSSLPTQPAFTSAFGEPDAKIHARIRLQLIRDLMRFEMPDCPGDLFTTGGGGFVFRTAPLLSSYYTGANISLSDSARYSQIRAAIIQRAIVPGAVPLVNAFNGTAFTDLTFVETNFNAELLFLIVESTYAAGSSGIEAFANSEIADTDGDGLREFVDAWGIPIQWLRCAAGFNEDVERSQGVSLKGTTAVGFVDRYNPDPSGRYWTGTTIEGIDPFDPNRADLGYVAGAAPGNAPQGILRPLIVSAGMDGQFGLRFFWTGNNLRTPLFSLSDATITIGPATYTWPDPYFPRPASPGYSQDANQSLGGVLNALVDSTDQTKVSVVTGVNASGFYLDPEFNFSGNDAADVNRKIRESVSDNITNFDETGGST